jgi:catechol 2,3-dioxygenase-like lactoylglutathione lyase family enzyme
MTRLFDRIMVTVPDMKKALAQYRVFLDAAGEVSETPGGQPTARWGLPNTVIQLLEEPFAAPGLQGIAFNVPGAGAREQPVSNSLGIDIRQCDGRSTAAFRSLHPEAQSDALSVDHVVLRAEDAGACIALFRDRLGIRLALDKTAPGWGGRMLFFRGGKLTLEVIESDGDSGFWGIAYRCVDIEAAVTRLQGSGVTLSAVREGRKPGTRVATVKSHCLDIPTLLIQQPLT